MTVRFESAIPHPPSVIFVYALLVKFSYEDFDLSGVRTYPLASRKSKASRADFASPYRPGGGVGALIGSMPSMLAGADLRRSSRRSAMRIAPGAGSCGASART